MKIIKGGASDRADGRGRGSALVRTGRGHRIDMSGDISLRYLDEDTLVVRRTDHVYLDGVLRAKIVVPREEFDRVTISGMEGWLRYSGDYALIESYRHNAFVDDGLDHCVNRLFAIGGGSPITHIGVTDDAQAVTAATVLLNPAGGGSNHTILAATGISNIGTGQATGEATFTNSNANFSYEKIGYLTSATDSSGNLVDVIGGGGSSPFNQSFTVDLTGATTWSATLGIDITISAS